jgi:hydroxyethylthiazole kinase
LADRITEGNLDQVVAFAKAFAEETRSVIAITSAIDVVSDGKTAYCIHNGHPMMESYTGAGCQLSALVTAFVAANHDRSPEATAAAVATMGLAGEIAYERLSEKEGNASYSNYTIDAIYNMTPGDLEKGAKYEVR